MSDEPRHHFYTTARATNAQRAFAERIARERLTDRNQLRRARGFIWRGGLTQGQLSQLLTRWGSELPDAQ